MKTQDSELDSNRFYWLWLRLLVLRLVEAVGQAALPAVMAVKVARHEHAGAALVSGTLAPQAVDLPVLVHLDKQKYVRAAAGWMEAPPPHISPAYLVVLQHGQLDLLPLVLVLLGGGVGLLLPLLGASSQSQHQVERGLLRRRRRRVRVPPPARLVKGETGLF